MNDLDLSMKITADPESGDFLAAYLRVRDGKSARTAELIDGLLFADYDAADRLLGLEFLWYCDVEQIAEFIKDESESVKRFVSWATPRPLVAA